MLFKDLKQGYQVYHLNTETLDLATSKVVNVSLPRFAQLGTAGGGMVVDITLEEDGATKTYTISETSAMTFAGSVALSTDLDGILKEVDAIKARSVEALSKREQHERTIEKCDALKEKYDKSYAEKREQDARISGIETEVKGLAQIVKDFIQEFKK